MKTAKKKQSPSETLETTEEEKEEEKSGRTPLHYIFGGLWKETFTPFSVMVKTEVRVIKKYPRADLILVAKMSGFNPEERKRLPDGIQQTQAQQVLMEFKSIHKDSINEKSLNQTGLYEDLYSNDQDLSKEELQSFVISSRTPPRKTLELWGCKPTEYPGVYKITLPRWESLKVILLNELQNTENNALVKLFSSRKEEREKARQTLKKSNLYPKTKKFNEFLSMLNLGWVIEEEKKMKLIDIDLSDVDLSEFHKTWGPDFMKYSSAEEIQAALRFLSPQRIEELTQILKPHERQAILQDLQPQEKQEILSDLSVEELEALLSQKKKENHSPL